MASKPPKKSSKASPAKAPKPKGPRDLPTIFSVKGTPAFNEWLSAFADQLRTTRAQNFDRAMAVWAEQNGFRPPPKRLEE
jgi:hypothetical protein